MKLFGAGRIAVINLVAILFAVSGPRFALAQDEQTPSVPEGADLGLVLIWAGGIGAAVAVAILIIVVWNRRLRWEVAERKRAEAALAKKEAQLRVAMDNMPSGMSMVDEHLKYQVLNERYLDLMEYPEGVIRLGDPVVKGIEFRAARGDYGAGDPDELIERRLLGYSDRESLRYEERLPSGKIIEFVRRPVPGGGMVAVATDITERKRAEEALRESEARAKAILNTAFHLQGLLKSDGTLIEANTAALSMINASKEELAGRPFWDCPWWTHNPDLQVQLRQAVKQAADGETIQFLATHRTSDGIERIIDFRVTPVTDEKGKVALIVPEGHDITDLKQAEAELRQAKEQAETALEKLTMTQQQLVVSEKMASLGQLTAGIAHEIKNPLNFVNNFAGLSVELIDELRQAIEPARQALSGEQHDDLDDLVSTLTANMATIEEQGRRADGIVKSMLQHARDEGGERRHIDVNMFLEETLNLAYHGARAQDPTVNIALERDLDPNAGSVGIAVQEVSRVLLNLFTNSIYAMRQRQRLEISADYAPVLRVSSRDCGDRVEIHVRDNGTGIPEGIVNKIFDPFFTTKPPGDGTGLGLSLSYDTVVHQHGGSLSVESEEDRFTEFVLVLPRHPVSQAEPVA